MITEDKRVHRWFIIATVDNNKKQMKLGQEPIIAATDYMKRKLEHTDCEFAT